MTNEEKIISSLENEFVTVNNIDELHNKFIKIREIIEELNISSADDGSTVLSDKVFNKIDDFNNDALYNNLLDILKNLTYSFSKKIQDTFFDEESSRDFANLNDAFNFIAELREEVDPSGKLAERLSYRYAAKEASIGLYSSQFYEIMNNMTQKLTGGFNPLYNEMQKEKIAKFFNGAEEEYIEKIDENGEIVKDSKGNPIKERNKLYQSYDDLVNNGFAEERAEDGKITKYGEKLNRDKFDRDLVTDINMATSSLISHPKRSSKAVYRGTYERKFFPIYKVGKEIKVNQFTSTTKNKNITLDFIGGFEQKTVKSHPLIFKYALVKIQLKGKNAVDITENLHDNSLKSISVYGNREQEVLVIPGAKYKVKKVTENVNLKNYNGGGSPTPDSSLNNKASRAERQKYIDDNLIGSFIECEETGEDLRKNKNTNNIYSEIFSKNDFGKFNSKFGSYVKKDAEFWKEVNLGSIRFSNKAVELRQKFRLAQTKEEKKALVPQIIKAEKEEPSPSPSVVDFSGDIQKMDGDSQEALSNTLAENEFTGYDSYLLKQFLLSNNYKNMYPIPKKLDDKLDDLQNQEIFLLDSEAPKKIGGGKYHTVYKTKVMQGNEEKEVIWKSIATNNKVDMGKTSSAYMSGINKIEGSAALAERSILTKTLDNYLFPNNSVCAGTKAANMLPGSFGGNSNASSSGIIMDMAKGKAIALREVSFDLSKGPKDANNIKSFDKLSGYISNLGDIESFLLLAATSMKKFHEKYPQLQVSKLFSRLKIIDTKMEFNDTKVLKKALEGTIRLGILDYISGQVDRHYENYYVAADGTITAIDNDMSFGSEAGTRGQKSFLVPNKGSLLVNLPKVITSEIREELVQFFAGEKSNANSFLDEVKHVFPENSKEYIAVQKRMEDVKKLVIGDDKAMVTDDILSKEAIDKMDSESNYLIRDLLVRQSDATGIVNKFGWNQFRSNRKALKLDTSQIGIDEQCNYLQNSINELRVKKEANKEDTSALTEYEQYLIQSMAALKAKRKLSRYKLG